MGPASRGSGVVEEAQQFHGDGHDDDAAVLLGGDFGDGLQQPQLQGSRVGGHGLSGLGKLPGCLVFAVGADDPCAALTFSRSDSNWSMLLRPVTARSEVWATCETANL